ncbi:glycosyltransferase [Eubacteriales bacterium OttesenSCG-928-M02]|nr:glycosyltransferase [Eubacteriales bacterium OttesenSCG-928-M02]
MERLLVLLQTAISIFSFVSMGFLGYQVLMALFCFQKRKKRTAQPENQKIHRFAIVTSARNEAAVIGHLADSLVGQNYPRDCFDVYIIADNCTDDTARVAQEHGAIVKVRNDMTKVGKGHALKWIFDIIQNERPNAYDAYCIFDADNLAHPDYLSAMNYQLCCGVEMAQGYRDAKNPSDSWVSGAYAIYFWCLSRFFFLPRDNMGVSCVANGTGFMFRASLIADGGWNTSTITEDTEFSIQQILKGKKVVFVEDAIFYDEQPTEFQQSMRQRYRWAVGNMQCLVAYLPRMLKYAWQNRSFSSLDAGMILLMGPCTALTVLNMIFSALQAWVMDFTIPQMLITGGIPLLLTFLVMMLQGLLTVVLEKKSVRAVYKGILGWPLFLYSAMAIFVAALFARKVEWKPIRHTQGVSLEHVVGAASAPQDMDLE